MTTPASPVQRQPRTIGLGIGGLQPSQPAADTGQPSTTAPPVVSQPAAEPSRPIAQAPDAPVIAQDAAPPVAPVANETRDVPAVRSATDTAMRSKVVSVRVPEVTELRLKALTAAADPTKALSKNQVSEAVMLIGLAHLEQYLGDPAALGRQINASVDRYRRAATDAETALRG